MKDTTETGETVLTNAQLVLADEVVAGHLVMRDGVVADVGLGPARGTDCGGDWIAPGLVELHTDNLERHMSPRPKVKWPHDAAIIAHDRELAGCGITTVFDAIRVGSMAGEHEKRYGRYARSMADEILAMRAAGALKISHHLHLRAETCSETLLEELDEFGPEDRIGIVSLMDHTPGQRQFSDLQKYKDYVCGKHGLSEAGFGDYCDFLTGLHDRGGARGGRGGGGGAVRRGAGQPRRHDGGACGDLRQAWHPGGGIPHDRGRRTGLPRAWHPGHHGGAEPDPGRVAFGQCGGA